MTVTLLTEYHLEFVSLTGGCIGWSESTLVKMPHCWKSHVVAHMLINVSMSSILCYYHTWNFWLSPGKSATPFPPGTCIFLLTPLMCQSLLK